jgi:hypothetical protein
MMNRRDFLQASSSTFAGWALSRAMPVLAAPSADGWRTFEVVTRVELLQPNGVCHIWLPAPLIRNTPYQKTISAQFTSKGGTARLTKDKQSDLGIVSATYAAHVKPALILTSRVALKNYAVDLSSRAPARRFTRGTGILPSTQSIRANRWNRQTDCVEGDRWRKHRHREGAMGTHTCRILIR